MRRFIHTGLAALIAISTIACSRFEEDAPKARLNIPEGAPATLQISFGSAKMMELTVGTKAEASEADESRVQDLYVMIFDNTSLVGGSPKKIYGRYFSYEHLSPSLAALDEDPNEGWWVENKTLSGVTPAVAATTGAVKVSTITCSNAFLVVLANVTNAVSSMSDDPLLDDIAYLNGITTFAELQSTRITLEQDVVNRKDLFLMMGSIGKQGPSDLSCDPLDTREMIWGSLPKNYSNDYKVSLETLDAKVKFMIRCNRDNIDKETAVNWKVCSAPDKCYLFSGYNGGNPPDDVNYFDSGEAFFEGTVQANEGGYSDWYVFTFYMLENRQSRFKKKSAASYHDREKQLKQDTGESGYSWWWLNGNQEKQTGSGNYYKNGKWEYASDFASYVCFDMILTLNSTGIEAATGSSINNALTTDTIYSVHLGDFGSSGSLVEGAFDRYDTERSCYYIYKITIDNSGSIYAEVENDNERQPGQEGFLLLTNDEIVNADAHYEYHSVTFTYNQDMNPELFSWYVKTPFCREGGGGPSKTQDRDDNGDPVYSADGSPAYIYSADGLDYKWVKFAVNDNDGSAYSDNRKPYPGDGKYDETWKPSLGPKGADQVLDINQLIEYIFDQTAKKKMEQANDFLDGVIKVTIYIDEYYYESDPLDPEAAADPDLWRRFVNAAPREMHILSDARQSRDRKSDVILSSHSVIQQSIQTIYNIYAPGLRSLWGCEHKDEIREKVPEGWLYWPSPSDYDSRAGADTDIGRENGRLNSAYIWKLYSSQAAGGSDQVDKRWDTYLNFNVNNSTPELQTNYQGMAFSCLSRNRDNNGNGIIDRDEVRWYMASTRQLVGMWVGNEALSLSARLYQPASGQWRAHVVSSTDKKVCWAEEGAGATDMKHDWEDADTWGSQAEAAAGETVRCLRNIGTYDGPRGVTDISYAPYDQEIDKYFTITTEGSGTNQTTTFSFERLSTKSIREYSEGELPYHDQKSLNNRVYVKMTVQPLSNQVDEFNVQLKDVNPNISAAGKNVYCPEGYRLPNQTEYVLMSLYMDPEYFRKDKDGNFYSGNESDLKYGLPSRTYYDRGYYGSLRQTVPGTPLDWSTEKNKVGWIYGSKSKLHCSPHNQVCKWSRCVRDDVMTGTIHGDIIPEGDYIYPGDWSVVTFNFTSTASAISYASLKLCYNAHSGNYREVDIPITKTLSGVQFRDSLRVSIPSLNELGLEESDYPVTMTLQAEVRNLSGRSLTVKDTVYMDSPLKGRLSLDFPSISDENKGLPIQVKMSVGGHRIKFSSATLWWKESGGSWQSHPITNLDVNFNRKYTENVYLKDIIGNEAFANRSFLGKRYSFKLKVTTDGGHSDSTTVKSMEIARFYFTPNPVPGGGWTSNSQCNVKWGGDATAASRYQSSNKGDKLENLNFGRGDFIEADIDMTNCVYVYMDGTQNNDMGKDNIFGFSTDNVGAITNSIIWYYPSVQYLVAPPGDIGKIWMRIHAGKWDALELYGTVTKMNLILDQDGILRDGQRFTSINGKPGNWDSRVKAALTGASTIYVGSQEGTHLSRATYNYVRVIRNAEM